MNKQYWELQPTDKPWTLNGFRGTWNFSDHSLVAEELRTFLMECFPHVNRFRKIPLEDINRTMNDVWEGPGSMVKLCDLYNEMKAKRTANGLSRTPIEPIKDLDQQEIELVHTFDLDDSDVEIDTTSEEE